MNSPILPRISEKKMYIFAFKRVFTIPTYNRFVSIVYKKKPY